MYRMLAAVILVLTTVSIAGAGIKTEEVTYQQGGVTFKGFLAYDDAVKEPRPGVLVYPEWWGLNQFAKNRAQKMAELGYVAFAADMYGDGKTTEDPKQATEWSGKVRGDTNLLLARANAALDQLKNNPHVDPKRIAATGYCMGGTVALQLALSGADLSAVITFHGGLDLKNLDQAKQIKGKILICTGADDAFVPPEMVQKFEDALRAGGVDYEINVYSGAHHAFTNPDADKFHIPNIAYQKAADERSWSAMRRLLDEVFPKQ